MVRIHWSCSTSCHCRVCVSNSIQSDLAREIPSIHNLVFSCDLEEVVQRIEWTTLMFFGSMFIAMECMARLGLIRFVGKQTENLIFLVDAEYRLALAIVLILGVCFCKGATRFAH